MDDALLATGKGTGPICRNGPKGALHKLDLSLFRRRGPAGGRSPHFYQHVGLYAYRREFLLRLAETPQAPLERLEKLEQLRVLHAGHTILVAS